MVPLLQTAGFFVAIGGVLWFSSWAEGWLAPIGRAAREQPLDAILGGDAAVTPGGETAPFSTLDAEV